jgi:hypothetical protein
MSGQGATPRGTADERISQPREVFRTGAGFSPNALALA